MKTQCRRAGEKNKNPDSSPSRFLVLSSPMSPNSRKATPSIPTNEKSPLAGAALLGAIRIQIA